MKKETTTGGNYVKRAGKDKTRYGKKIKNTKRANIFARRLKNKNRCVKIEIWTGFWRWI